MTTSSENLAGRLNATLLESESLNAARWLFRPLLELLARGEPVSVDQLAAATARPTAEVRAAIDALADVELDDQGRIVGNGITLRPTPHRFTVDGKQLYTWCALDTLIFPALLGRPAEVESASPVSGQAIRLIVAPDGVASVDPPTAVVSLVTPDAPRSIRAAFCNQVHFFTSSDEAGEWLADHPGASVVPVSDGYRLARSLADAMTDADRDGCC